jgi:hypothetical protein
MFENGSVDVSVVEPEMIAEEPKLNCLSEPSRNYELHLRLFSIYYRLKEIL